MEKERWLQLRRAGRRGARKVGGAAGVGSVVLAVLAGVASSLPPGYVGARLRVRPHVSLESFGHVAATRLSVGGSFSFEARVCTFDAERPAPSLPDERRDDPPDR